MRTLFLNPPSFEGFDGGAGSRWPAAREIESYWYPVWICYPAGMLPDSKVVDAPPHKISIEQTIEMAKDFIVRREFDYQIADYAKGKPLEELPGVSFRKNGSIVHNPEGGVIENLDE